MLDRSICQTLLQIARAQPDLTAIVAPGGERHSYAMLVSDIVRFAIALEVAGVRPGHLVGLETPDRHAHLLMIFACQAIGAASVSFSPAELRDGNALARDCDVRIFSSAPGLADAASWHAVRCHAASAGWLRAVRAMPVEAADWQRLDRPIPRDRLVRLVKTSGTTGASKTILVTAGIQQERLRLNCLWADEHGPIRHLSLYNFTFEGAFSRGCVALVNAGQVVFADTGNCLQLAAQHDCNSLTALVGDAEALLAACPPSWTRPRRLLMSVVGARLPESLRAALLARIATELDNSYSSNETGRSALVDDSGVATILPGVTIAIRDAQGAELADGEEGQISIRSAAVASGYRDSPELNLRHFGDGWFHSSDWGFKPDPAHLVVLGRADAMLNIGGRKIPAERIEADLRALPGVSEAAMVSFPSAFGVDQLGVMLEVPAASARPAVLAAATALLERHGTCRLALTDAIPRTETRKVRKSDVVAWFLQDTAPAPQKLPLPPAATAPAPAGFASLCRQLLRAGHAAPDRLAVIDADGSRISLAGMIDGVVRMVTGLRVLGARPGLRVGIECADRLVHLQLVLACQAIGAASVSFAGAELREGGWLAQSCDLILVSDPALPVAARLRHDITHDWLQALHRIEVARQDWTGLDRDAAADELVRIPRTSGSTGAVKAIRLTAGVQAARLGRHLPAGVEDEGATFLSVYNMTVEGNYLRCCQALIAGVPIRFTAMQTLPADLAEAGVSSLLLLVADAEALLASLPADWVRPGQVALSVGGAALPVRLGQALLARCATTLEQRYSSNETGLIATTRGDDVGRLLADVEIRLRDAAGNRVPEGSEGLISVRSPAIADGYLAHSQTPQDAFDDGWFHTQDWGMQPDAAHLVVLGRADGLLNIGGRKIPAERIEDELCAIAGVTGAAMAQIGGAYGVERLAVMLEVPEEAVRETVFDSAGALLERYGTCQLAVTAQLPRTERGKLRRADIITWFQDNLTDSGPDQV